MDAINVFNSFLTSFLNHVSPSSRFSIKPCPFTSTLDPLIPTNSEKESSSTTLLTSEVFSFLIHLIPHPILNATLPFLDSHCIYTFQCHPSPPGSFSSFSSIPLPKFILLAPGPIHAFNSILLNQVWTHLHTLGSTLLSHIERTDSKRTEIDPFFDEPYSFFSNGLYCSCSIFQTMVVKNTSTFLCPHILAYHLLSFSQPPYVIQVSQECWKDMCFQFLLNGSLFP